jgi:hypothetical protein
MKPSQQSSGSLNNKADWDIHSEGHLLLQRMFSVAAFLDVMFQQGGREKTMTKNRGMQPGNKMYATDASTH